MKNILNTVETPNSHIFVRSKKRWLFGYVWLFGYFMTIWVPRGFRIKGIGSSIRIRFLFIIRKIIFWVKKKLAQIQSCITQFFKNNKKWFARRLRKSSFLFFWYPPRTQIVKFSWDKKGCDYLGMCDYSGCDYLEESTVFSNQIKLHYNIF